jgi:hypothetical protein
MKPQFQTKANWEQNDKKGKDHENIYDSLTNLKIILDDLVNKLWAPIQKNEDRKRLPHRGRVRFKRSLYSSLLMADMYRGML